MISQVWEASLRRRFRPKLLTVIGLGDASHSRTWSSRDAQVLVQRVQSALEDFVRLAMGR